MYNVSGIRKVLNESSEDDDDTLRPNFELPPSSNNQGYIFSFNSLRTSLTDLHPTPSQISYLWQLFSDNVDQLAKVLHKPSMQVLILNAKDHLDELSKPLEALLFAVYFASITSMTESECSTTLLEEKGPLLARYRFALQQALARAGFLNSRIMMTLQALVILLTCKRNHEDSQLVWPLTGVAIRVAQSLGIHRDGSVFKLRFFESEMRRRIWWHLCLLDVRSSETHGYNHDIAHRKFDTKLPLHIDDKHFDPSSSGMVATHVGFTDMTLPLTRYEIISALRQLRNQSYASYSLPNMDHASTMQEIDTAVEECARRIEDRYLQHCDINVAFQKFTVIVSRMMLARMWINVHHPFQLGVAAEVMPAHIKDRIFFVSVDIVEAWIVLDTEEKLAQWRWAFQNYIPWQALAFILSELCTRSQSEAIDRAWNISSKAFENWTTAYANNKRDQLWLRMNRLMAKARKHRSKIISTGTTVSLEISGINMTPSSFPMSSDPGIESHIGHQEHLRPETTSNIHPILEQLPQSHIGDEFAWPLDDENLMTDFDGNTFKMLRSASDVDFQNGEAEGVQNFAMFDEIDNWW